jgi:ribosomal protein S18 acetylase RimI-like enzyme
MAFLAWQRTNTGEIDVNRLCVDPACFRRGLAAGPLIHLLAAQPFGDVTVSTGAANTPAIALYTRLDFAHIRTHPRMRHRAIPAIRDEKGQVFSFGHLLITGENANDPIPGNAVIYDFQGSRM